MITRIKIKGLYVWLELKEVDENNYNCYYYFREPTMDIRGIPLLDKDQREASFRDKNTALIMGISFTENKIHTLTKYWSNISGNRHN